MRGAEAIVSRKIVLGKPAVLKDRIKKSYRIKELDDVLRVQRTRREARLLHKAKLAGVSCPVVLRVSKYSLLLSFLQGKQFKSLDQQKARLAGESLAKLHKAGIIHGDFTPINLIFNKGKIFVIDFGLGYFSSDVEDQAIDVLTMLKSLDPRLRGSFLKGYAHFPNYKKVLSRVEEVKARVRYA